MLLGTRFKLKKLEHKKEMGQKNKRTLKESGKKGVQEIRDASKKKLANNIEKIGNLIKVDFKEAKKDPVTKEDLGDRMLRIRTSLDRINTLLRELKEQSQEKKIDASYKGAKMDKKTLISELKKVGIQVRDGKVKKSEIIAVVKRIVAKKGEYVIVNTTGEFWNGKKYVPEYPDGKIYTSEKLAIKEAEKAKGKATKNYGLASEEVVG